MLVYFVVFMIHSDMNSNNMNLKGKEQKITRPVHGALLGGHPSIE